ncbi:MULTISPECIES: NAD(P)-binding protein [unclassified Thiocapsa]|uniref:NAD(P)-binding protein n=1 Tax=unclassified Thiocapsa TaxID=2641286 RepID=UPI0035AD7DC9
MRVHRGTGIAGLACMRHLTDAGYAPLVLDKGRGIGGWPATRRIPVGWDFDHGAQDITTSYPRFQTQLKQTERAGRTVRNARILWDRADRTRCRYRCGCGRARWS